MYSTALRASPANRCRRTVNISHNFSYVKHNRKKKVPCRGRKPAGFSSLCEACPLREAFPHSGRKSSGMAGRIPSCGVPLRGAKTQPGFHPYVEPLPVLAEGTAAGRQNTVMWRLCFPCGRAMPPHGGILPAGNDAGLGRDE
jgi:hypothetical protein